MPGSVREIKAKKEEVTEAEEKKAAPVKEEPEKEMPERPGAAEESEASGGSDAARESGDRDRTEDTVKSEPEKGEETAKSEPAMEKAAAGSGPEKEEAAAEPEPDADAPEETDPADRTDDLLDVSFESVENSPADTKKKGKLAGRFGKKRVKKGAKTTGGYVPGKKKFKFGWLILVIVAVLIVIYFIRSRAAQNAPMVVSVEEASLGDIEEIVTVSGTVASAEKKAYYAGISAPVKTLNIEIGDRVKKGDVLLLYNEEDLELAKKQAELNVQQAQGSYSGSMEKNAKATNVLRGNSIGDINNRLDEITAEIDAVNLKITEKTDRMSGTITELQNTLQDINQNGIADSQETAYTAAWNDATGGDAEASTSYITRLESGMVNADSYASESDRQMYLAVQQSLNDKQYALAHDPEIEAWQRQIQALNEEKATLSEQKSAEMSKLTGGEKSALAAQKELTELSSADAISDIEAAESGVTADFTGVVTELTVEEGATVAKGTRLLSIASTDDVEVNFQITKADMTRVRVGQAVDITVNGESYEGEVIRISGSATKNASGVPVVDAKIRIKNPDDKLILGVEASNKIHTNHAEDVVVIPYEYVGSDADGDFVYLFRDGQAVRQNVVVGLTTSTQAQIAEGLEAGDLIITSDPELITDGMVVTREPESAEDAE